MKPEVLNANSLPDFALKIIQLKVANLKLRVTLLKTLLNG